jgi:hypothetical protein
VIEYSSNKFGTWRRVDIESLMLGDKRANDLPQHQLYALLKEADCPRINIDMGKPDLLFCLGVAQQEAQEAAETAPPMPRGLLRVEGR